MHQMRSLQIEVETETAHETEIKVEAQTKTEGHAGQTETLLTQERADDVNSPAVAD